MLDEEPDQIIRKSKRALAEWTWLSALADRPDELVDVLNREARLLASVAFEHPEKALKIIDLINEYKDLVSQVEVGMGNREMHLTPLKRDDAAISDVQA